MSQSSDVRFAVAGVFALCSALLGPVCHGGLEPEVLWQFQTGAITLDQFITVAPDGTIYTSDNDGFYALSPDGKLIWFVPGLGGGRPIGRGDDGTLYVSRTLSFSPTLVAAVSPAGDVLWEFTSPTNNKVKVGPKNAPQIPIALLILTATIFSMAIDLGIQLESWQL